MRCEHLHDSAVYVLGALSPPEREAYERHLADCAECRAEVAEFGELPVLLGRLDMETAAADPSAWAGPSAVPQSEPLTVSRSEPSGWAGPSAVPAGDEVAALLPRVLDRASRNRRTDRRRRRWQGVTTALVAAFLGVIGVLGVRAAGVGDPETPDFVAMREVASTVPVSAKLALSSVSDGTVVHMQCVYKPEGGSGYGKWTYKLVVVPKSGEPEELDSWTAGFGDEFDIKTRSRIPRGDIQKVEIRKGDGTPLLVLDA